MTKKQQEKEESRNQRVVVNFELNMAADNISVDQCKRKFIDFLVDERLDGKYSHRIEQCIREKKRFILNINDVRADENDWASRLIRRPREHMIALQEAVIETGKNLNPEVCFSR